VIDERCSGDAIISGVASVLIEPEDAVFFTVRPADADDYFRTPGPIRPLMDSQGIVESYIGFHCPEITIRARIFVSEYQKVVSRISNEEHAHLLLSTSVVLSALFISAPNS